MFCQLFCPSFDVFSTLLGLNVDISFKDLIKRIPFLNDIYEKSVADRSYVIKKTSDYEYTINGEIDEREELMMILNELDFQHGYNPYDNISRNNEICFIYSVLCGLCSFVFTDFGQNYTIYDEYCAKKRKYYIKNIEKSKDGLVSIQWNEKGNPNVQEYILFKDVEGMIELNYDESAIREWMEKST